MKKFLLLILSVLIFTSPVFVSCQNGNLSDYKFTKPTDLKYNNVFDIYKSSILPAHLYANKIEIKDDFSAVITYEIVPNLNQKITEDDIEKINNVFKMLNEEIYTTSDGNKQQYDVGNRLFYVEEFICDNEDSEDEEVEEETTKVIVGVAVFCADLNFACNSYKSYSLEEFIKAADDKSIAATKNDGNKVYYYFKNPSVTTDNINIKSNYYVENQQNFKVLSFESYNSTREIEYIIDGKIVAYYGENYTSIKIDNETKMTVKLNSISSRLYILYETDKEPDTIWWIVGGAIALIAVFAAFLVIKLIRNKK